MSSNTISQPFERDDDFVKSSRPVANIGKRFYTWATLGSLSGAAFLVGAMWTVVKRMGLPGSQMEICPLCFSFLVVVAFAFASQPEYPTLIHQKMQKALVTIGNSFLVYLIVVGGTGVVTGIECREIL